ncbi:TPA: ClpXP protease specificity-enhancing factor [Haemophilus influenzae]|uniref:ClpXP protease specificity-enhancing factor n=1 Tax=Haemophilus influenzae TaxID=727 RepID=UPI00076678E2|nr:ClpXP protease specificity-enhancing factor [Haemophilus influenzae]MCK8923241.1 ClpXP protease specificity-enhancing factor [Haemophilus influenzae]MCK8951393.1 ClpXP protease specificity-enhancing factor [Haemophilus influenzae]MCK9086881.1 ClpXP protease specificity-enhancing factor [Haemophilus influenzae]MCK9106494.1 ClpXP protease specificity-enhancing factor [Haemophilus influenzae]MCK9642841.1 ClpXP protease specificity-enhancing factor [Haemophilus influenzae]
MEYKSSPKRPYLLRAYYDWLVDNSFTPYLVVDATYLGVNVPVEYVKDGQIVLNLSASATGNLQLTNDFIQFNARFKGVSRELYIPMGATLAIYARENGDGVMFEPEEIYDELNIEPDTEQPTGFDEAVDKPKKREEKKKTKSVSHLRIVD